MGDPTPRPLEVEGRLTFESDQGAQFQLEFERDAIVMNLPDIQTARTLMRQPPGRIWMQRLHERLMQGDLAMRVQVGTQTIARLGSRARPGLLSRMFRLAPMQIHLPAILRLLGWRRRGVK